MNAPINVGLTVLLRILSLSCVALVLACSGDERPLPTELSANAIDGGTVGGDFCATPNDGCPCDDDGEITECGETKKRSGDYVWCSIGRRTCEDGQWGTCQETRVFEGEMKSTPSRRLKALPVATACEDNPCDPYCKNFDEVPEDIDLPDGGALTHTPDGIELTPTLPNQVEGKVCQAIDVTPSPQQFLITGFKDSAVEGVVVGGGASLLGEYFNQRSTNIPSSWTPTGTRADSAINFDWGSGSPGVSGVGSDNFSVRWTGYITPPATGTYKFYAVGDDGVRLWVNDAQLIDAWVVQPSTEYASADVELVAGQYYPFRFEYFDAGGGAVARLRWDGPSTGGKVAIPAQQYQLPPPPPSGLQGEYFNQRSSNIPAEWTPTAIRNDTIIDFDWGNGGPGISGVGSDDFSVRWTGYITPPESGDYTFYTLGDDGVRFWLDGDLLVDDWADHAPTEDSSGPVSLQQGEYYPFTMEWYDNAYGARVALRWDGPGTGGKVSVPSGAFGLPPDLDNENDGPLLVEPPVGHFEAVVTPSDCLATAVEAAWDVDKPDRATISQDGVFKLFAPVAGPIAVRAYAGSFLATGQAEVIVRIRDTDDVSTSTANQFTGSGSGTDSMQVLYPYENTVFPLGIRPPVIQWDKGGNSASAVRVALRYPATGNDPDFLWEKITTESSTPRLEIPSEVWKAFEQTAKGQVAAYVVQRVVSGSLKQEVVRPIQFAPAPLRGQIVYTEYGRSDFSAHIKSADPGTVDPAEDVFNTGGCPVCHTVSANGSMFATADRSWGSSGGFSQIDDEGSFTELSDYPSGSQYQSGAEDWRGFGWAPLTPDGEYALAANNVWGNSLQTVVGIDSGRNISVTSAMLSGGSGIGLRGEYFANNDHSGTAWRRTDPTVNFDWGFGAPGHMPSGAFSVRWTGTLQPFYSETHTIKLETNGGVRLTLGGELLIDHLDNESDTTFSADVVLSRGQFYDIELLFADDSGEAKVRLRWSSPSTPEQIVPQTQLDWDDLAHGLVVDYYDNSDFTNQKLTRVEPFAGGNWGSGSPHSSIGSDYFSSVWTGRIEFPYTGSYRFCSSTDDDIKVYVGSTKVLDRGVGDGCGSSYSFSADTMDDLRIECREYSGDASFKLDWEITVGGTLTVPRQTIPHERLYLPDDYDPPDNGVLVTYYDKRDFNASLSENQTAVQAFRRIEPNIDHDWGNAAWREEYQALAANTNLSGRWTGTLTAPCTGATEFQLDKDDGGTLWLNGIRVAHRADWGSTTGWFYMDEGESYDFKFEWDQGNGGSVARLNWKPCGQGSFTRVPQSAFIPIGGRETGGFVRAGGDNGSGVDYFIWETPNASGQSPTEVTADSPARWGLAGATMMVPSFSPDGSKLAFVDGDQAGGAGWRKGLSTFDFDQGAKVFKNRQTIVNTWPRGDVIKWPVFETDSRSLIYSAAPPATYCCNNYWTTYGYMAPSDYYETPGRLFSVDSDAEEPSPVLLQTVTEGERAIDANKAWQPTMLPVAVGGYRWIVFTSTRPYGNTLNGSGQNDYSDTSSYSPMLNYASMQSQLWVAAIDDEVSGSTDRSHPAFWLPNQSYNENPADGFVNERGFWALEACHPIGTDADSECEVAEDCCGGDQDPPTATCRLDVPVSLPVTRHCQAAVTQDTCLLPGGACGSTEECCPGTVCVDGACSEPPLLETYAPANLERTYEAECKFDAVGEWHFFDWKAETPPSDSFIEVYVQTADDEEDLLDLPAAPDSADYPGAYLLTTIDGDQDPSVWTSIDVGAFFEEEEVPQRRFLKVTMRFSPNAELTASPVLKDFRMTYSCPPGF